MPDVESLSKQLQDIKEGLHQLSSRLAEFIDSDRTETAVLSLGDKSISLSSSKLDTEELLKLCAYTLEQVKDK